MFGFTPDQADAHRQAVNTLPDSVMYIDIGYFIAWYASVELGITALLALASQASSLSSFDTLCSGMDARVKIERLRKILKAGPGIGSALDERLHYFDKKARPIRNRLAHASLAISESGSTEYYASSLGSLPWKQLGLDPAHPDHKPPIVITPAQLLGWGAWFQHFGRDLSAAFNHALQTGVFEIVEPESPLPSGNR
ncbi:hypothetical protein [Novosphingobium sp.]|uniref:hypothetical protein n=1 Tax=Novosphingobium sp. TaxID=1874826 RepID=UPI00352BCB14